MARSALTRKSSSSGCRTLSGSIPTRSTGSGGGGVMVGPPGGSNGKNCFAGGRVRVWSGSVSVLGHRVWSVHCWLIRRHDIRCWSWHSRLSHPSHVSPYLIHTLGQHFLQLMSSSECSRIGGGHVEESAGAVPGCAVTLA